MSKGKRVLGTLFFVAVALAAWAAWQIRPGLHREEAKVVKSLRWIAKQQAIYKPQGETDQDSDGVGEYGFLAELAGRIVPRTSWGRCRPLCVLVDPPYIPRAFGSTREPPLGIAELSGYDYQVWLPGRREPITDTSSDASERMDPSDHLNPETERAIINQQEQHYVLYAWPVEYGKTGFETYVINEQGVCHRTVGQSPSAKRYNGTTLMPKPDAAFTKGEPVFTGKLANGEGNDGNVWEAVE